jgi:hypothetical protein
VFNTISCQWEITSTPIATLSYTKVDIKCNGTATGSIDLVVTDGKPNYSYVWSNGAVTEDINGLTAGDYTVSVTDASGCVVEETISITEPTPLQASLLEAAPILCFGGTTSIIVAASGGTAPYKYKVFVIRSDNDTMFSRFVPIEVSIPFVGAGRSNFRIFDANGCYVDKSIDVVQPDILNIVASKQDALCYGSASGNIDITISGGTAPYNYSWSNGSTSEDLSNLSAGDYTISVTDANGCTTFKTITIDQPSQPAQPAIACYETATFNATTCQWDVTGSPRLASIIISSDESKFSASSNTIDFNAPVPSSYSIIFKVSQIANGGSNPTYTWKRNGITVGTNSNTYTGTGWSNGETIQCILTSNATCVSGNPASSNTVSISVTLTNYFVVSDRKADRIFYYDADFNLVRSNPISSKKDVNAEDIWATSSDVYVLSGSEQRVYRINGSATTPSGSRKLRNTDGKNLKSLSGLAIIGNHLLVVEEKSEFIYRYNLDDAYNGTSNYNALQRIALNKDNKDAEALGYDAANNIIYVLDNDREKTIFRYPITSLTASRISVGNATRSRKMKSQNGACIKKALGLVVDQTFIRITDQGPDKAFTYRIADLFAGNNSVNLNALSANSLNGQNKYSTGISLFYSPVPLVSNISTPFVKKANNQYSIPPNTTSTIDLRVFSNPTPNQFGLQLISSDKQTRMTLRIIDINGRVVDVYDQLRDGQNLIIGSKYYQGIYFAELIQGNQRKVVRLMKLK